MANPDTPMGLQPIGMFTGSPYSGGVIRAQAVAGDSTALYIGDPVVISGAGSTDGSYPVVTKATAGDGNKITGVVVGVEPNPSALDKIYRPASTAQYVFVCINPDQLYLAQEDSVGGALTSAAIGQNISLVFTHAGSTVTGMSGVELDSSTASTEISAQCTLLGLDTSPNNSLGTNAKWKVRINQASWATPNVGV